MKSVHFNLRIIPFNYRGIRDHTVYINSLTIVTQDFSEMENCNKANIIPKHVFIIPMLYIIHVTCMP